MNRFIHQIMHNPVSFEVIYIFVHVFYCVSFAIASIPSFLLILWSLQFLGDEFLLCVVFIAACFVAFYIFLLSASLVIGFIERLLSHGFEAGSYSTDSTTFFRWLIYSGLHLWMINIVLPFLRGGNWIKIYLRIVGAKVGKAVFINTKDFYDPYLLCVADNVLIGGETFVCCHAFENGNLILGEIIIEEGTLVGAHAYLTPGTRTGKDSKIGMHTYLRRNTILQDKEILIIPPGLSMRQVVTIMRMQKKHNDCESANDNNML